MTHLLVTNDFPPKIGGIQSYLYELWSRLDPERFVVLTTKGAETTAFDGQQSFRIVRVPESVLLPTPSLRRRIESLAREIDAEMILLDPALPVGALGPFLSRPYGLVLHGAEVTVPARLPGAASLLRRTITGARLIVAAGSYPAREARHLARRATPPIAVVPPGVDIKRFHPINDDERARAGRTLASTNLLVSS